MVGEWLVSGCFKFTMESRKVLVWGFGRAIDSSAPILSPPNDEEKKTEAKGQSIISPTL